MSSFTTLLSSEYPQLRTYLGDVAFSRLIAAYGQQAAVRHLGLRHALARLPAFMARRPALARQPEVIELARLEQAQNAAFAAPDLEALTPHSLAGLGDGPVALHPSASLLRFRTNAISLAAALRCGEQPPAAVALEVRQAILVWRQGDAARYRVVGRQEEIAIGLLRRGISAATLLAPLVEAAGQKAPLQSFLAGWIEAGLLISKVEMPSGPVLRRRLMTI